MVARPASFAGPLADGIFNESRRWSSAGGRNDVRAYRFSSPTWRRAFSRASCRFALAVPHTRRIDRRDAMSSRMPCRARLDACPARGRGFRRRIDDGRQPVRDHQRGAASARRGRAIPWISRSVWVSSADVASSSTRIGGAFRIGARNRDTLLLATGEFQPALANFRVEAHRGASSMKLIRSAPVAPPLRGLLHIARVRSGRSGRYRRMVSLNRTVSWGTMPIRGTNALLRERFANILPVDQ